MTTALTTELATALTPALTAGPRSALPTGTANAAPARAQRPAGRHRASTSPGPVTPAAFRGGIDALLATATTEVLVMSTQTVAVNSPFGPIRPVNHDNLRRGVRYRVLVPDGARTAPLLGTRLAALSRAGATIRTLPRVPTDTLVVDGAAVVHPAGHAHPAPASGVTVFRLDGPITTAVALFEREWATAAPMTGSDASNTTDGLTPREQQLLSLLAVGFTDAAAADRLDVSVRTVRRMVADMMVRLGARGRFMAGVKAASRGWLTDLVR